MRRPFAASEAGEEAGEGKFVYVGRTYMSDIYATLNFSPPDTGRIYAAPTDGSSIDARGSLHPGRAANPTLKGLLKKS